MSEKPDIDRLADTVRDQLADEHHPEEQDDCPFCLAVAALDELVALARTLLDSEAEWQRRGDRSVAAEARVAELEAALRDIRDGSGSLPDSRIYEIARAALAGDGGGAPLARDSEANPFAWFGGDGGGA